MSKYRSLLFLSQDAHTDDNQLKEDRGVQFKKVRALRRW